MKDYAPIAVFVYNRPEHTKRLIESLLKNDESIFSEVYFFSDGPKSTGDNVKDLENLKKIQEVRDYLGEIHGFKGIHVTIREVNIGLAHNVINGVTEILNKYGKIIVLEDDLVVSKGFLGYMNNALNRYQMSKNVYSISGYSFVSNKKKQLLEDTFFLPITCSWSWGTWKDKWECFDEFAYGWESLLSDSKKSHLFNFGGVVDYTSMLKSQMEGKIDSWAIRWYWSVFKVNGLTLYPSISYVHNGGFDGSGTHTKGKIPGSNNLLLNTNKVPSLPDNCVVDEAACKIVQKSLREKWYAKIYHVVVKVFGIIKKYYRSIMLYSNK